MGHIAALMDTGRVLIFVGPPGSGKGTQASRISAALHIPAISTGEILRRECQSGSELGQTVAAMLSSGQLVSDELMNEVVARRFQSLDCTSGCILDGYPRTVLQARSLDCLLARLGMPGPIVIDFVLSARDVVSRLEKRRQCARCGRSFSIEPSVGKVQLTCDLDGSPLVQRTDDYPGVIRERLRLYKGNSRELVRYYRRGSYHRVRANRTPDEVSNQIFAAVKLNRAAPVTRAHAAFATRAAY